MEWTWLGPLDVHDEQWFGLADSERRLIADFVESQGVHRHLTWRVEYRVTDRPCLRFYCYLRNRDGQLRCGLFGDIESSSTELPLTGPLPSWWRP